MSLEHRIDRREALRLAGLGTLACFEPTLSRATGSRADARAVGGGYQLVAHCAGEAVAERALHAASLAWPRARRLLGWPPEPEDGPSLEIHLYPDKAAYARVEQRLTGGYFRDNESFSHWDTMTAHVALAPPVPAGALGLPTLSSQTLESIAHEAAHLAVYATLPNYRWHPTWLAEGLALSVERRAAVELGTCGSVEEHPRFSTNLHQARSMLAAERLPDLQLFLVDRAEGLGVDENYALWQLLFDTLAAMDGLVPALWREIDATPGGPAVRARVLRYLAREVGLAEIEAALRRRIEASEPHWDERGRTLDTSQRPWIQRAFPGVEALAWHLPREVATWNRIEATVTLLSPDAEARLLVGRAAGSGVLVALSARRVCLAARAADERGPDRALPNPLALGTSHYLELRLQAERVHLALDRQDLLSLAPPNDFTAPPNQWGLGVSAGDAVAWSDIRAYSIP